MSMSEFIHTLLAGLLSGGTLLVAAVFVFKLSFERLLDKQIEVFKAELSRDLEVLKSDLAKDLERVKASFSEELEIIRSGLRIDEATKDVRFRSLLEFRGKQLANFYWPMYLGLQKDNVIWRRILDKRDAKDDLKKQVGAIIERDVVIPNHERMVALIEENLHLAEADEELDALLLRYIRHVAVYKAIRVAGEEMVFPLKLGEEWPHDLPQRIETKTKALQAEYDMLLERQRAGAETSEEGVS